ncbi:MAG TPA: hypothetical protein VE954_20250 [Oligoflexus sp.]|uniref:hypothetical protein n=1 Tax=Oligoflexus sp. TaxID=1971216 RepID=UPI002D36092D|nr:hypothetical protein [Oligoflexus sp.]HYX35435.1 hypothetical protein [Oligoflexus sp.]
MTLKRNSFNENGFTRVSVLLGVALASVFILVLSFTSRQRRPAKTLEEMVPLQETLQDALTSFVRTKIVQTSVPCADPAEYFRSHLYLRSLTSSVGQARSAPTEGLSAAAWDNLFHGSMAASSFAGAALSRCPLSLLGTGGRFHFCLQVERDLKAPKTSFLHTPLIFTEVSIQLIDLKTGHNLSCAQYLNPRRTSAGASVEYLLFAIDDKGEQLEVTRKKKVFSVRR